MPLVYDRLMDKVIFASTFEWFAAELHSSQSLLSIIKEPQFNYLEAQKFLQKASTLSAVLLVDLAKAFEVVPRQIMVQAMARQGCLVYLIVLSSNVCRWPRWFQSIGMC